VTQRVVGELSPVKLSSDGVLKPVSVWTPKPSKSLLHTQLELEARVGIERVFVGHQSQYFDIRCYFAPYFIGVQAIFATTRRLPAAHTPLARLLKKSLKVLLKVSGRHFQDGEARTAELAGVGNRYIGRLIPDHRINALEAERASRYSQSRSHRSS
jgi:hypothetical protein